MQTIAYKYIKWYKLYINKNVNKIRIEVGVVWPYGNHNYTKPGEKIVGSKIAYIKTFNFTREDYKDFLKQYKEENWDWREYKKIK